MHLKMPGRVPNEGIDGQMKRGIFLRLLPNSFHQTDGNSWAIGKLLSVAVITTAAALVLEKAGEEIPRDGNINLSTYSHRDDEEYGFVV